MTDFVSFLLETDAAKRRLAWLFESEALGWADHLSTVIVARDRIRAARTSFEQKSNMCSEYRWAHRLVRVRTRTAIPTKGSGQIKRDLTVSSFVVILVLVGAILAAYTEQPIFWLLIGPAPVALLHTIRMFLRQRLRIGAKDYASFGNRIDDTSKLLRTRNAKAVGAQIKPGTVSVSDPVKLFPARRVDKSLPHVLQAKLEMISGRISP